MAGTLDTHEVFNQSPPYRDINLFESDRPLAEAVAREGGEEVAHSLSAFGARIGAGDVLDEGRAANSWAPVLHAFDASGHRIDAIEFHPAYHAFMARSMAQGLHCQAFEHVATGAPPAAGRQVARFAGIYLMSQVEAGHVCPITMTHACTAPLFKEPDLARDWLPKILSRDYDPASLPMEKKRSVTVGMGMTEKQGGTDVRANTSSAEPLSSAGREYVLTGHKWFMSAPMCDAFMMLAQAPGGLSCFFVPRLRPDGSSNGLRLLRLKNKMGNRSNASSEVEFAGAQGTLVGEEGRGVATILEMVTLTRQDCAASSAGLMRWGLVNALHHARHRSVFQKKLIDQPLMAMVLADMALDVEAATALVFRLARAAGRADEDEGEAAFLRLMTPVAKYWCCKSVPPLVNEAMECVGGNGYVEDGVMAPLYREAPLNAIWEGSGNVMCLDVLRALEKSNAEAEAVLTGLAMQGGGDARLGKVLDEVAGLLRNPARAVAEARFAVEQIALLCAASELRAHAPGEVADTFIASRLGGRYRQTYGTFGGAGSGVPARQILARVLED